MAEAEVRDDNAGWKCAVRKAHHGNDSQLDFEHDIHRLSLLGSVFLRVQRMQHEGGINCGMSWRRVACCGWRAVEASANAPSGGGRECGAPLLSGALLPGAKM